MDVAFLRSLPPANAGVAITELNVTAEMVTVALAATAEAAACPQCRSRSSVARGRYRRTLRDRPCLGRSVRLLITARKSLCRRTDCPRRVYRERLPELTAPTPAPPHLGLALGGEPGARLADPLSMPTSPDTILRRVKDAPGEPAPRLRYVGTDDWATRKGHTYGTIVIDLGRGRDGEALKIWLTANRRV
jgi:transposase